MSVREGSASDPTEARRRGRRDRWNRRRDRPLTPPRPCLTAAGRPVEALAVFVDATGQVPVDLHRERRREVLDVARRDALAHRRARRPDNPERLAGAGEFEPVLYPPVNSSTSMSVLGAGTSLVAGRFRSRNAGVWASTPSEYSTPAGALPPASLRAAIQFSVWGCEGANRDRCGRALDGHERQYAVSRSGNVAEIG